MIAAPGSFCVLPFVQLDNDLDGTARPCCWSAASLGNTRTQGLLGPWNAAPWRELRRAFVAGERPATCGRCWELDDQGVESPRVETNQWNAHLLDLRRYAPETGEMRGPPRNLVLRHSNVCNLACRMCAPNVSSSVGRIWDEELVSLTGKPAAGLEHNFPDPASLRADLLEIGPGLNQLALSGGEPLADPAVDDTLRILAPWARRAQVYATTNLSRLRHGRLPVLPRLTSFRNPIVCVSIDGPPALHGYVRPGLDLERFLENLDRLQRSGAAAIHVNVAVQALNALFIPETLDFVLRRVRPQLIVTSLADGPWDFYLDARNLPVAARREAIERCEGFAPALTAARYPAIPWRVLENARGVLERVARYLASRPPPHQARPGGFAGYYQKLDRVHGTRLAAVAPALARHLGVPDGRSEATLPPDPSAP